MLARVVRALAEPAATAGEQEGRGNREDDDEDREAELRRALRRCGLGDVVTAVDLEGRLYVVVSPTGEAGLLRCGRCGHAATVAAATSRVERGVGEADPGPAAPALERRATPGVHTIARLAEVSGVPAGRQIKTLFYRPEPGLPAEPAGPALTAALVRGDRTLNEAKLARVLGVRRVVLATREEVLARTGAPTGSAGPVGLRGARIVADEEVMTLVDTVCGANEEGFHFFHVYPGRDFTVDEVADLRTVGPGDACPCCGAPLAAARGIVVARAGRPAATAAADGRLRPAAAAAEPAGVVAAVVELYHDEAGIIWPPVLAPCQAVVVPVNASDPEQSAAAASIHDELTALGVEVVLDDRDERVGAKFTDADLIGFPFRVTVGPRGLARGRVEVRERATGNQVEVPVAEAAARVAAALDAYS